MAETWACRLSLRLACKSFPGLCACTRTGQWCASVVAIRSLFTNWADRCSQINSLDSWCATRVSKTLGIVHRYALEKDQKKRLKGHGQEHVYNTLGYIYIWLWEVLKYTHAFAFETGRKTPTLLTFAFESCCSLGLVTLCGWQHINIQLLNKSVCMYGMCACCRCMYIC